MNSYIETGYAGKLSKKEATSTSNITNYIPHHSVVNPNKPDKLRIVYDAGAQYQNTTLNQNLIKGPDKGQLKDNLVGVLLRFRKRKIFSECSIK